MVRAASSNFIFNSYIDTGIKSCTYAIHTDTSIHSKHNAFNSILIYFYPFRTHTCYANTINIINTIFIVNACILAATADAQSRRCRGNQRIASARIPFIGGNVGRR